ncbi:MAG: pyruvate kinase, partial [Candidatus Deferrimicrobiaceae bacterium]
IDAVSQSFVESGADIRAVRQAAEALDDHPFIIAKIERSNALEHTDDILDAADGVMIARGDLGVEVPIERTALIQKELMRQANRRAKTVITATQMLESMTDSRRPTRAEATDVANAILMPVWVAAVSSQQQTCQNLVFSCGVYPVYEPDSPEDGDAYVRSWLERHQGTGDLVILTEGPSTRHPEAHNRMEIIDLRRRPGGSS